MAETQWDRTWREAKWLEIESDWDVLVIGGGITGAGILREATRLGLRALLVERRDFAWGTSSRSSKLVHGGLRYLKSGQIALTRASVQGREELLVDAPGLVEPLGSLLATYEGDTPGRFVYNAGLGVYDLMAMQWNHRFYDAGDFQMMAPYIATHGLRGGFGYLDAQTDDARLVLRVLREAAVDGGVSLNYTAAESLLRDFDGAVVGAILHDLIGDRRARVNAKVVVNATGAWADTFRTQVGADRCLRPLRGSHLIFPAWRLPVAQAVNFLHPVDKRPVFALPWEGVTLVGTTDVDCVPPSDDEPSIAPDEVAYLMAAVTSHFPALELSLDDVIATFAGIRPVVSSGRADPSDESRDHVVHLEQGLLTVTGGKLTTFRHIARDALAHVQDGLPVELSDTMKDAPVLDAIDPDLLGDVALDEAVKRRLAGRFGRDAVDIIALAEAGELEAIPGTPALWVELRWAAMAESVEHLDDLLLRRVRVGLLLPNGAAAILPRVRAICQPALGWADGRWEAEEAAYLATWQSAYSVPDPDSVPDWREMLHDAEVEQAELKMRQTTRRQRTLATIGALSVATLLAVWLLRRRKSRLDFA